jgi:hypothetical protein
MCISAFLFSEISKYIRKQRLPSSEIVSSNTLQPSLPPSFRIHGFDAQTVCFLLSAGTDTCILESVSKLFGGKDRKPSYSDCKIKGMKIIVISDKTPSRSPWFLQLQGEMPEDNNFGSSRFETFRCHVKATD